jgi:hypothetical protein
MSEPAKIIVIDNSPDIQKMADVLKENVVMSGSADILHLRNKSLLPFIKAENPFDGFKETDLKASIWLGHSGTGLWGRPAFMGDFTPAGFVDRFSEQFEKKFRNKEEVGEIFLVGCEAGLGDENGNSLAQQIADKLYNKGFTKAVVHAVANPPQQGYVNMRVSIVTAGLMDVGCIGSYLLTRDQDKQLSALNEKLKVNEQEIAGLGNIIDQKAVAKESRRWELDIRNVLEVAQKNIKDQIQSIQDKAVEFLNVAPQDVIDELRRPHNTFYPTSLVQQEKTRTRPTKDLIQELILNEINKRIIYERKKHSQKTIKQLKALKKKIAYSADINWGEKIDKAMDDYKKVFPLAYANSTTYQILGALVEIAQEKCGYSPKHHGANMLAMLATNELDKDAFKKEFYSMLKKFNVSKVVVTTHATKKEEKKDKKKDNNAIRNTVERVVTLMNAPPKPTELPMPPDMMKAIDAINAFIEELQQEEKNRWRWVTSFSLFPVKHYKIEKLQALAANMTKMYEDNKFQPVVPDWKEYVRQAQSDKELVYSFFSHRTENLLKNIIKGNFDKGIYGPKDKEEKWMPLRSATKRMI